MALIQAPYGTSQIKGSVGSKTFQQTRAGLILRERTTPVNPNTPLQNTIRSALTFVSNAWVNTLTPAQRTAWDDYAALTPLPNKFGELKNVGGRQMFIRCNNIRQALTQPVVSDAPGTPGVEADTDYVLSGDTTNGVEVQSLVTPVPTGGFVTFLISPGVSQARNYHDAPYSFALFADDAQPFPSTLKAAALVSIGQRYFVRSRTYNANGKVSSNVQRIIDITS